MKKTLFALLFVSLACAASGQEKRSHETLRDLSVDFMMGGYFYAGSKIEDKDALGGFGTSDNFPKAIDPSMRVHRGVISLVVKPDEAVTFEKRYRGLKVLLVNATKETIAFSASDIRLNIVQEALDRDGQWKPIEALSSSWCGNSYHRVFLGANEYWEFAAARYTGGFKTKLRFRLDEQKSETEKMTIFSDAFEGSVNAGQFATEQGYQPTSIMDPYNH